MIHVMYSMNEAYIYHMYKYVGVCFDGVCEHYTYIYIRTPTDRLRMCIAVVSGGGQVIDVTSPKSVWGRGYRD